MVLLVSLKLIEIEKIPSLMIMNVLSLVMEIFFCEEDLRLLIFLASKSHVIRTHKIKYPCIYSSGHAY